MDSLQVWLAIAGAVLVCVVLAYNSWVTRRNTPRQPKIEPKVADSALPRLDAAPQPAGDAVAAVGEGAPISEEDLCRAPPQPAITALIDAVAPILLDGRVLPGEALLAEVPTTRRVGSKPLLVEAQNANSGAWEFPVAGQRYRALRVGAQLANRTGSLTDIEFSEFIAVTQRLADAVRGAPDLPDMRAQVEHARELDEFARRCDAQLNFSVRARRAVWSVGFVRQCASGLGFVGAAVPGSMVLPADGGKAALLTLSFDRHAALSDDPQQATVREVTLGLDVPQVEQRLQPFARLCELAQALAQALEGELCDEAGQPLAPEFFAGIAQELDALYKMLDASGLPAGSAQARRLFS
ncbi:MAG: cell division protein FtsZ [Ottowia sp.]|nr:cell division protein FtsZ [Ottowia sp.]